ncbi:probable cytochrome P450 6g2 [Bradysia coprophila]|uniref:probable cytochrome P450 6g2 n=1 Tax=Bradysia coprophila TaxID=38358 RepID=UPI00187DB838|nr:probable cytochrome P450 6g2 [Bradysia coprophila]
MLTLVLFAVAISLLSLIYYWAYEKQNYWKVRSIPHIRSPLLLGHFYKTVLLKESNISALSYLYNHPDANGKPFVGINVFHKPTVLVRDPDLIKRILITDFQHFPNHHTGADPVHDPIGGQNLFQIKTPHWRELRVKLSPTFSSGKMKQMFYMVENVGNILGETVDELVKGCTPDVEMRSLFARFTIDSISIVAFGTESGCLKNPQTSEFFRMAQISFQNRYVDKVAGQLLFFLSNFIKVLRVKTFHPVFEAFLRRLYDEVMIDRMKSGETRNDLIDTLIALKQAKVGKGELVMSNDILVAQAAVFLVAGFETSSSTLEFFFYLIAKHPNIQTKIRQEILEALAKHGKMNYELIASDLPYLTAALKETLRLYPILPFLDRECDAMEGYSMEPYSSFKIPRGMPVYIPIYSLQRDPEYFPDPDHFIPERFYSNNGTTNEFLWLPFSNGPRNCIGERFAMMQMKIAIVSLLKSFSVELTKGSPKNIELDKEGAFLHSKQPITLKFVAAS